MAAYYGDMDGYTRLRRPLVLRDESFCCVHGIYHNTMFALWWARQEQSRAKTSRPVHSRITRAITVADNSKDDHDDLPYLMWYPSIAAESTYRELFHLHPSMALQIERVSQVGTLHFSTRFRGRAAVEKVHAARARDCTYNSAEDHS